MWELIWVWKFQTKPVINTHSWILDIKNCGDNIVSIDTQLNLEQRALSENEEEEEKIIWIIDNIINLWIWDYEEHIKENWRNSWKRNLLNETLPLWDEMYIKTQAIEETLDFIADNDWDVEIYDWFLFWAIEWVLENYRDRVFDALIENEIKITLKK